MHVKSCEYSLTMTCMKCIVNASSGRPHFTGKRPTLWEIFKRGVHVQRAPLAMPVTRIASGPLTTHLISAQSVQLFPIWKKGAHFRVCCCTQPRLVKRSANGSLTTGHVSAHSVRPFRDAEKGAHLHVRTGRCAFSSTCVIKSSLLALFVSRRTTNLVAIGRAIPELYLCGQSRHPSLATCQADPTNEANAAKKLSLNGPTSP